MLGASWYIRLLGGLSAERDGHPLMRFQTRKTGGLLAYLAYHLPDARSREILSDLFWPDSDADKAYQSLNTALTSLRRQLEPPDVAPGSVIVSTRLDVRLNSESVRTDVQDLKALSDEVDCGTTDVVSAASRAITLYRGPLVPGLYEEWVEAERDRLAVLFLRMVLKSVQTLEARGDLELALEHGLAGAAVAPDEEQAHGQVIRLYRQMGRDREAARQYRVLEERLRVGLDASPSVATRNLLDGIRPDQLQRAGPRRDPAPARRGRPPGPSRRRQPEAESPPHQSPAPAPAAESASPSLPKPLTRFFGREEEIALLATALAPAGTCSETAARLMTITGPAGSGKTRLALEVGSRLSSAFGGRVYFVPLGPVFAADVLYDAIHGAVGKCGQGTTREEQIVSALAGSASLLILDNAEHLGDEVARAVVALLVRLSDVTILVTSRAPLLVTGERRFPLSPLPTPSQPGTPDRLMEFAAVRMFVDRAQAVTPDFQITPRNAGAIAAVCHKLEGIPLAIELAAARTSALTPAQVLEELKRRFRFLVSKHRTVEERHRTLDAALDWSFDLLPASTRLFFARLSLFRGGWSLEAARAICEDPDDDEGALDHLERLVAQALITTEIIGETKRFAVLESVREFAEMRLNEPERNSTFDRLAQYFIELAEREAPNLRGPRSADAVAQLQHDLANFRTVLSARADHSDCLRLSAALWRLWYLTGQTLEGVEWLRRGLLVCQDAPRETMVVAYLGQGAIHRFHGDLDAAAEALEKALDMARESGMQVEQAGALNVLALVADDRKDHEQARQFLSESLQMCRELGDRWSIAGTLNNLGYFHHKCDELDAAERYFRESHEIYRSLGDWNTAVLLLSNLGALVSARGDYAAARTYYEQSLMLCRRIGMHRSMPVLLYNLGDALMRESDHPEAPRYLCESIHARLEQGDRSGIALPLGALAHVAILRGDCVRAGRLHGAISSVRERFGEAPGLSNRDMFLEDSLTIRSMLSPSDYRAAWEFGMNLTLEEIVAFASELPFSECDALLNAFEPVSEGDLSSLALAL